ncbi:MAG TPA: HipA N-terminal domain-containing protein [Solirubrobacterales bacterium]|nr:HipA N-terminal domain-containing protein [Solirubrobacterales bacterium]
MALDVHLRGAKVASLRPDGEGYVLAYDEQAVERLGTERARISLALPPRAEPHGPEETRVYVEGLLPRGPRRRRLAHELGVDPTDGYGLIAELGRDCPGAVTFLEEGEQAEPRAPEDLAWLSEDELAGALDWLPQRCFDPGEPRRMRFTLPGERHKLALVRDAESGRWAWPEPGVPSTHVVIPESGLRSEMAVNEYVCSNAVRALGLPVGVSMAEAVAGRNCLVSPRFDRWGEGVGAERLHQESFQQAIGIAPDAELSAVEGLVRGREVLFEIEDEDFPESFFSVAFCAWALGDRDERFIARLALMHGEDGPLPGLFCGIYSEDVYREGEKAPLLEMAERCSAIVATGKCAIGMMLEPEHSVRPAFQHLHDLDDLLGALVERSKEQGWHGPVVDQIHYQVSRRIGFLREETRGR